MFLVNKDETFPIRTEEGSKIELEFVDFQIEHHSTCAYDYVEGNSWKYTSCKVPEWSTCDVRSGPRFIVLLRQLSYAIKNQLVASKAWGIFRSKVPSRGL